jgi:hypothetical protein
VRFQDETTKVDGKEVYLPICDNWGSCNPNHIWYARFSRCVAYELEAVCEDCHGIHRLGPEDVHKALEPQRLKDRLAELQKESTAAVQKDT